ncbi:hypothetical protein ABID26_003582 [Mesorhizobium shonense]|uniref:Transposase n=1 Tax=Mesorhizobium shonense TaxID=1209948 RepID=A0ABV2HU96_9HYPH
MRGIKEGHSHPAGRVIRVFIGSRLLLPKTQLSGSLVVAVRALLEH